MTTLIDPKHVGGTTLDGDPHLIALADLYDAATAASVPAGRLLALPHKGRRLAAIAAHRAVADAAQAALEGIDAYMHTFRQPVEFRHNGWRWAIPSAGRGLICTRSDHVETRSERKEGG